MNKKNRYIHVPFFAIQDLKLRGNELLLFSYLYQYRKHEDPYCYNVIQEITKLLDLPREEIVDLIRSLQSKKLIVNKPYMVNNTRYHAFKTAYQNR